MVQCTIASCLLTSNFYNIKKGVDVFISDPSLGYYQSHICLIKCGDSYTDTV